MTVLHAHARLLSAVPNPQDLLADGGDIHALIGPDEGAGWVVGRDAALRFDGGWETLQEWLSTEIVGCDPRLVRALATLTFDPARTHMRSTIIVPRRSVVMRDGHAWEISVDNSSYCRFAEPAEASQRLMSELVDGSENLGDSPDEQIAYPARVLAGLQLIADGELSKIVLATRATQPLKVPAATVASRLQQIYQKCWTYCVDGMVGASPELLVRLRDGALAARVLAGTVDRSLPNPDAALGEAMAPGGKNRREHAWAVDSAVASVKHLAARVDVSAEPYALVLPNVIHLASDLTAHLREGITLGHVLDTLHPTAAVGGTPTQPALAAIARLEGFDRGRFAGPVGWIDGGGDAELVIALRGGQCDSDATNITMFAGAGIVAGSDPQAEWAEVNAKLRPMREALA